MYPYNFKRYHHLLFHVHIVTTFKAIGQYFAFRIGILDVCIPKLYYKKEYLKTFPVENPFNGNFYVVAGLLLYESISNAREGT